MVEKRKANEEAGGGGRRRRRWDSGRTIKGPGIFVSCVRGKERKAADELIVFLEDIVGRRYDELTGGAAASGSRSPIATAGEQDDDSIRNGSPAQKPGGKADDEDDLEAQIRAELADLKGGGNAKHGKRLIETAGASAKTDPVTALMTDMECFFFVSVSAPIDPVKLTCALLDEVKNSGQARSRFVHRLSPVQDTVHAEADQIRTLARTLVTSHPALADPQVTTTYRVDLKMRLHTRLAKMDVIRLIAACIPEHVKTQLKAPELVLNVEIFRMTVGIAVLPKYELYKRYNPLMLAEETQSSTAHQDQSLSRVVRPAESAACL